MASSSSSVVAAAPKTKRVNWTDDEDNILIEYVKKNEAKNWEEVAKNSGLSKTGNSCYLRWKNHLKPGINKGPFTEEEEAKIIYLRKVYGGNKWSRIASELPGRNDKQVQNHWNTYLSKNIPQHSDQVHQVDDEELSMIFTEEVDDEEPSMISNIFTEEGLARTLEYLNYGPLP